jgi:hypothetical protein
VSVKIGFDYHNDYSGSVDNGDDDTDGVEPIKDAKDDNDVLGDAPIGSGGATLILLLFGGCCTTAVADGGVGGPLTAIDIGVRVAP